MTSKLGEMGIEIKTIQDPEAPNNPTGPRSVSRSVCDRFATPHRPVFGCVRNDDGEFHGFHGFHS